MGSGSGIAKKGTLITWLLLFRKNALKDIHTGLKSGSCRNIPGEKQISGKAKYEITNKNKANKITNKNKVKLKLNTSRFGKKLANIHSWQQRRDFESFMGLFLVCKIDLFFVFLK